ncbi:DUF4157 domain-containing protein [Polyangium sp. 15x6]|uniref:eCIS core domain-containing protein n=1 Tax=Polyangium sp. 15x6 TaxID=3042687 RepID=UPI00249C67C9|nr:DUF4157 domain-containing protein [Polyangium sp. 15x6]MDI3286936.1 DUF4157 domain-containing protein [Polyangium sp. 15x6]
MSPKQRVIQACYPANRIPAAMLAQAFFRPHATRPPHAAKAIQRSTTSLPPHPATVAQRKSMAPGPAERPPHAATRGAPLQRRAADESATVDPAQPSGVHAFQPPTGFLEGKPAREGQSLPPSVLRKMETFFEADFSDVRVHVGGEAASIGAIAFTLGTDIHFAPGFYEPHTARGQELLGHELTHVVQQREGRVANPLGDGIAVVQDFELEAEADRMGRAVATGQPKMAANARPFPAFGPPAQNVGPLQMRAAQAKGAGYRLIFGTYMHENESLPEPLAGHSFVALEEPTGERHAFGFSPRNYGSYDPHRDLGKLMSGVPGVVHDDGSAFEKPGVRLKEYPIDAAQAQAAMAKVAEYQSGRHRFNLQSKQCSAFALDVLRAADVKTPVSGSTRGPRDVYEKLR